jgi:hypothetical protein
MSSKCILKLIFNQDLYDEMTDAILSFPPRELAFLSMQIQVHSQATPEHAQSITEQVSGFKRQRLIEITLLQDEAQQVFKYISESLPQASFEAQLVPLLSLD